MGSKIKQNAAICPKCGGNMVEVGFNDNHGMYETMEYHCPNRGGCGYAIGPGPDGEVRNPGRSDLQNRSGVELKPDDEPRTWLGLFRRRER